MPSALWMPEDEYNEWNALRFKKEAEAAAFPHIARRAASLSNQGISLPIPPPEEPPELPPTPAATPPMGYTPAEPIPTETPLSAGLQQPTVSAPPLPAQPEGPLPGFLPQRAPGLPSGAMSALVTPPRPEPSSLLYDETGQPTKYGYSQPEAPPMPGDITTLWQKGIRPALDFGGPEVRRAFEEFPRSPESILGTVTGWPGGGAIGRVGTPAATVARTAAPAAEQVVRAGEAVVGLPPLREIIAGMGERATKLSSYLDPGRYFRIEKGQGAIPVVHTDDLHLLLDAVRRQRGQIDQPAGAMATAIRGKWEELGNPFKVKDGIIQEGPAQGNAFLDVMSWSPEDSWNMLTPQQAEFSDYFHRLQDQFVGMVEAGGTRINKILLPDGRRYIHEVFTMVDNYRNQVGAKIGTGVKQTFEFRRSHTEEDAVLNLLQQGRVETLDDPSAIFFLYAQEVLKKAADSQLIDVLKPLGVSVRERVGQPVIDAAIAAAQMKRGAQHMVRAIGSVVKGASPAGASLRAIRQNFPQIGNQLDQALTLGPKTFNQIMGNLNESAWRAVKTTPEAFTKALAEVRGMEAAPRAALTQQLTPVTEVERMTGRGQIAPELAGTFTGKGTLRWTPVNAPISYSDIEDALSLVRADEKGKLDFITEFYKHVYQVGRKERTNALKDVLIAAQGELQSVSRTAQATKNQYSGAVSRAAETTGGWGDLSNIPGLRAAGPAGEASFPGKRAQLLNKILFPPKSEGGVTIGNTVMDGAEFASRIRKALGPQGEQKGEAFLKLLTVPNMVIKTGQVLFDLSGPLIQGFPVLMSDPVRWGKAAALSYKTFVDPSTRTNWLARPENYQAMKEFIEAGGKLGASDWMEAIEVGGPLAALTGKLSGPAGRIPGAAFLGEHINPAESFAAFSDISRVMTWQALRDVASQPGAAAEVADFAAKLTGGRGMYGPIYSPYGHGLNQLAVYAMDYTKASLALATDVFKPGVAGDQARWALGKMTAMYPAVLYAMAQGVDAVQGESRFANPDHDDFVFNPEGRYFLRVPMGGDVISYAGIWPALIRTTVKSTWEAAKGHPEKFAQAWGDFGMSRMGPLLGQARTQITGQTFRGEPLTDIPSRVLEAAKGPLPLTGQALLEGQEPASLVAQFAGAGTARKTLSAQRDELLDKYAKESGAPSWDALALDEQRALRKAHPDVIQAQDVARARQAATGRGEWKTYAQFNQLVAGEREKIKAEIADLTRQFKAKEISGQKYRDAIQQREFEIGRLSARFQGQPEFAEMPVTPEEYATFEKRMDLKPAPKTPERESVNAAIERYYAIGREFSDKNGFIADLPAFMRAREKYMASLPESVRGRVEKYASENKDPELAQAQKQMGDYMKIPAFLLRMSPEEEDAVEGAMAKIQARSRKLPPFMENKQTMAFMQELQVAKTPEARAVLERAFIIMKKPDLRNPQRRLFWSQHPLLQKYYSDVVLD